MKNIEDKYNEITEPNNFVKLFKTEDEFLDWLAVGTVEDLYATLETFLRYELYEYCTLIHKVIDNKKSNKK